MRKIWLAGVIVMAMAGIGYCDTQGGEGVGLGFKRPKFTTVTEAMAFFRGNTGYTFEEMTDMGLSNGFSAIDKAGKPTAVINFLAYLSGKVPLRNVEDKLVLMSYLKDESANLRFIAGFALEKALSVEPKGGGMVTDMLDVESKGHREMVERIAKAIVAEMNASGRSSAQ